MFTLSPGTLFADESLSSKGIMVSKRVGSKDTIERNTGDVVEQVPINLPIYADTQVFIEKEMKITW